MLCGEMLYESLGHLPKPGERLRLTGGCSRALLPASPGHPSGDPFGRYVPATFQLPRIFPDPPRAGTAPLTPTVAQKAAQERLAGDISRYGSKQPSPIVDSTEVAKMKRNP